MVTEKQGDWGKDDNVGCKRVLFMASMESWRAVKKKNCHCDVKCYCRQSLKKTVLYRLVRNIFTHPTFNNSQDQRQEN